MDHLYPRSKLRRTNSLPTKAETYLARDQIAALLLELHRLDAELSLLLAKRARIIDRVERCQITLAPHKNLPPELIGNIIQFAIEDVANFPLTGGALNPRLQLTQVCSAWRKIAFNTPKLWDIVLPRMSEISYNSVQLIDAWYSQCSLSRLSLRMPNEVVKPCARLLHESAQWPSSELLYNKILVPYAGRFRVLEVVVSYSNFKRLLSLPPGTFAMLEDMFIRPVIGGMSWGDLGSAFSSAPRLRHVTLGISHRCDPMVLQLPWAQLTALKFGGSILAVHLISVLSNCTSLQTCAVNYISPIRAECAARIAGCDTICLPNLKWLHLGFACPNLVHLLRALVLPNLTFLRISSEIGPFWNFHDYTAFFQPMASTLRHFELCYGGNYPIIPRPRYYLDPIILSFIPHVTEFKLPPNYFLHPQTLDSIACGEFLREVKSLVLNADSLTLVAQMLTTRQTNAQISSHNNDPFPISFIKSVQVRSHSEEFPKELTTLREQGMHIEVVPCTPPVSH